MAKTTEHKQRHPCQLCGREHVGTACDAPTPKQREEREDADFIDYMDDREWLDGEIRRLLEAYDGDSPFVDAAMKATVPLFLDRILTRLRTHSPEEPDVPDDLTDRWLRWHYDEKQREREGGGEAEDGPMTSVESIVHWWEKYVRPDHYSPEEPVGGRGSLRVVQANGGAAELLEAGAGADGGEGYFAHVELYDDAVMVADWWNSRPVAEEPVGYVDQPDDERCFTACLASLTGLPLDGFPMPPKERNPTTEVSWHNRLNDYLRSSGWRLIKTWRDVPRGHAIATGPSPRRDGFDHCVITLDGQIVHDPHPSRDGVAEIHEYEIVVPIRPIGQPLDGDGGP